MNELGVENRVASIPSHSEPDMRLSPHPALVVLPHPDNWHRHEKLHDVTHAQIAPLLRMQHWRCLAPFDHDDSGGVIAEDSCIRPFRRGFEVQCGLLLLNLMG